MSRAVGLPPAATISAPSTAIMAPLSVHMLGRGVRKSDPALGRTFGEQRAQPAIRGNAAADQQVGRARGRAGVHSLRGQNIAHGLLEARCDIGQWDVQPVTLPGFDPTCHSRLQTGE